MAEMREQMLPLSNSIDLEEWEKVDDFPGNTSSSVTSHEVISSSTARGQSRGHSTSRRANAHKGTAVHSTAAAPAVMTRSPKVLAALTASMVQVTDVGWNPRSSPVASLCHQSKCILLTLTMKRCALQIWIAGILALSVFWCMVSLIAISRLETRLPSEMQEQLEFHASFSGLWPRSQAGVLDGVCRV